MRITITALLFLCIINVQAQSQKTVDEISKVLQNEVLFIKYRSFKSDFENMNINKGKEITNFRDYEKLRVAYKEVESKYNEFLINVKSDLSKYDEIKKMAKTPADYALKYQSGFREVINVYENSYLPIYNSLNKSKAIQITPSLIQLGLELFSSVVNLISSRKEDRNLSRNAILGSVNTYFYKQIRMKEWGELPVAVPNTTTEVGATNPAQESEAEKPSGAPTRSSKPVLKRNSIGNKQSPSPVPMDFPTSPVLPDVTVPAPTFEELRGWVEFSVLANNQPSPMAFIKKASKSITVAELRTEGSNITSTTSSANVAYFNSVDALRSGAQFNIKVFNKAGLYIFALNSNNKIEFLYPFKNERLGACDTDRAVGKDITVLEATPVVGQDADGITTLPIPNCEKRPPAPRYFTIEGNQTTPENFCLIFSRSELNTAQIAKRLEAEEGPLHDRLTKTFGNYLIAPDQAGLDLDNNRLTLDASGATQNVLPIVFYINRN